MNLKSLVSRELGEGLTEEELASAVDVSRRTIANILTDKLPQDRVIWKKFAKYFRMDVDFLRTGRASHATTIELTGGTHHSAAGHIRKIPLLNWHQIGLLVTTTALPRVIRAEAVVEATDVSGRRTFALKVKDDSMEPLFRKGEMIFVNPDLQWKPGDYIIVSCRDGAAETVLLRAVGRMGRHCILHPLNQKYDDLPLTNQNRVWGKVVRLRKNL